MNAEQLSEALSPPALITPSKEVDSQVALMAAQRMPFAFSVWFPLHVSTRVAESHPDLFAQRTT